jgi:hypothetical protein
MKGFPATGETPQREYPAIQNTKFLNFFAFPIPDSQSGYVSTDLH